MSSAIKGKRILITRAKSQAESFANKIKTAGGIPVVIPLIAIVPPKQITPLREAVHHLQSYDWLVLTSQNGVEAFFSMIRSEEIPSEFVKRLKIAVVGEKTREPVVAHGFEAHVIPDTDYTAEALVEELLKKIKPGDRIVMARGNLARDVLPRSLRERGFDVHDVVAYETVMNEQAREELIKEVLSEQLDAIAFTSSSTVNHFVRLLGQTNWRNKLINTCLAAIGPITEKTMRKHGLYPDVVAKLNTIDGILHEIEAFFKEKDSKEEQ